MSGICINNGKLSGKGKMKKRVTKKDRELSKQINTALFDKSNPDLILLCHAILFLALYHEKQNIKSKVIHNDFFINIFSYFLKGIDIDKDLSDNKFIININLNKLHLDGKDLLEALLIELYQSVGNLNFMKLMVTQSPDTTIAQEMSILAKESNILDNKKDLSRFIDYINNESFTLSYKYPLTKLGLLRSFNALLPNVYPCVVAHDYLASRDYLSSRPVVLFKEHKTFLMLF